ncbi:hypothetical protein GCM10009839_30590 [Catenulispora yoronensis]|uniref:ATP-grasp domain-containing protein n=1 Tax=Catenulispora yoronensis TaxID=450799 RepID=A0ABP5FND4_9ACTN
MSTLSWAVVTAETDPARAVWTEAARAAAVAGPRFVDWRSVAAGEAGFHAGETVFCERLAGWAPTNPVGGQRARHREFAAALDQLSAAVDKGGAVLAAGVAPMLTTLDRLERDQFLRRGGIPVLERSTADNVGHSILRSRFASSDDWLIDGWHTTLFVHRARTGFEVWRSPAETVTGTEHLKQIVAGLEADTVYVTETLHRAHLADDYHDIRFGLVDGKVTHAAGVLRERIVGPRQWYGGRRRELDDFLRRFGASRWERLVALAERTAALFPDLRLLGVDLIVDNSEKEFVFDVDPFGADLPGRRGEAGTLGEGLPVHGAVLRALSASS